MSTTVLNVKMDPRVKTKAKKVAEELGFSLSAAVNALVRDLIRTKTLNVSALEEKPSARLVAAMKEAERDHREGKTIKFSSPEKALKFLDTLKRKK